MLRRARSLIWHPEEKLWNWTLLAAIKRILGDGTAAMAAITAVIGIDSLLLAARARRRIRSRELGRGTRGRDRGTGEADRSRPAVLYIDCGVHKDGEQIRWMHRWFAEDYELHVLAFEASAEHVRDATAALADLDGVRLFNLALVGPDHTDDHIRLYKSEHAEGQGDSLFAKERDQYEVVPARRLSRVLADEGWSLSHQPVILRMNIEGAEHLVIEDLIDAGLHRSVDGYYGMWDDLAQVDPAASEQFRRLMRANGIATLSFNDRDVRTLEGVHLSPRPRDWMLKLRQLSFILRQRAIRQDIESAVRAGLRRTSEASPQARTPRQAEPARSLSGGPS